MKKSFLSNATSSKLMAGLLVIGGALVPVASTQADTSQIPPDRFLFGSAPTDYKQFSEPMPAVQSGGNIQSEGAQGPIRTETMSSMEYSSSYVEPAQRGALQGEQPTDYRWFDHDRK